MCVCVCVCNVIYTRRDKLKRSIIFNDDKDVRINRRF